MTTIQIHLARYSSGRGHLRVEVNSLPALRSLSIFLCSDCDATHHSARKLSETIVLSYGSWSSALLNRLPNWVPRICGCFIECKYRSMDAALSQIASCSPLFTA